jgi:hypothetical protein
LSITLSHTQEQLTRAHLYGLAGTAGVNLSIERSHDYGVDGSFHPVFVRGNRRVETGFPIQFQAKSTINWEHKDGLIVYDLAAKNYNDLVSRSAEEVTLMLILLALPKQTVDWHVAASAGTTLRKCCYWHVLSGTPKGTEEGTVRIKIPDTQLLTPFSLNELLDEERSRRLSA